MDFAWIKTWKYGCLCWYDVILLYTDCRGYQEFCEPIFESRICTITKSIAFFYSRKKGHQSMQSSQGLRISINDCCNFERISGPCLFHLHRRSDILAMDKQESNSVHYYQSAGLVEDHGYCYSATGITLKSFWDSGKQKEKPKWNLTLVRKWNTVAGSNPAKPRHFFVVELAILKWR